MVVLKEIAVANGIAVMLMWFLLICRRKNRENIHTEDKLYDGMAYVNLFGALCETVSFFVDGQDIAGGIAMNYISNSLCLIGTVSIAVLWCLYVDLRIYRNYRRTQRKVKFIMIPWLIELVVIIYNLFGTGILFNVSEDNIYSRGDGAFIGYLTLVIYFAYSIHMVYHSKNQGINLNFFPILSFIGPCFIGVVVQLFCYGISTSWVSVAIALTFVQMQSYAENIYTDELSGLYNRRYLNGILEKREQKEVSNRASLYGIMMDLNDFKEINDMFGHSKGDSAICMIGNILFKSIPDGGIAIRYAGDEFIVLLPGADEANTQTTIDEINKNITNFNESGSEPFTLSAAMGYAQFEEHDSAETFLTHMDARMYEAKRKYHFERTIDLEKSEA